MEYLVKVELVNGTEGRPLYCDLCGDPLIKEPDEEETQEEYTISTFYVWIYEDKRRWYIEKFICPKCKERIGDIKVIGIEKIDLKLARAIYDIITDTEYRITIY